MKRTPLTPALAHLYLVGEGSVASSQGTLTVLPRDGTRGLWAGVPATELAGQLELAMCLYDVQAVTLEPPGSWSRLYALPRLQELVRAINGFEQLLLPAPPPDTPSPPDP